MSKDLFFVLAVDRSLIDYSSGQENQLVLTPETLENVPVQASPRVSSAVLDDGHVANKPRSA